MGCCCSSEDSNSLQDEPNSRTRLLQDPVSSSYQVGVNNSTNEYGNNYGSSAPQKSDDHSALYKALQQIGNKVIDVGALDCQTLEEHEHAVRGRVYAGLINKIHIPQNTLKKKKPMSLVDVPTTEKGLSAPPISEQDYSLITIFTERIGETFNSIQVIQDEDLFLPFGKG